MKTRREVLLTGASLAPLFSSCGETATESASAAGNGAGEWRNRQSGMAYRRLGRTGYMVSEVVMGGNTISPDNYDHVLLAMDMGLNYLDTAPAYGSGKSELGYAKVIAARPRDSFFLNSKVSLWDLNRNQLYRDIYDSLSDSEKKKVDVAVSEEIERTGAFRPDYVVDYWANQRKEVEDATLSNVMARDFGHKLDRGKNYRELVLKSVDESLQRLGTDYLDLLMCPHGASTDYEIRQHPEIFEAFETLRKAGKVRHFGLSSHSAPSVALEAAMDMKVYAAAMVAYNVVNHQFVAPALERAKREDFGVVAMKVARPIFSGNTRRPVAPERVQVMENAFPASGASAKGLNLAQRAYMWALANPAVSAVISEMTNAELVKANVPLARNRAAA